MQPTFSDLPIRNLSLKIRFLAWMKIKKKIADPNFISGQICVILNAQIKSSTDSYILAACYIDVYTVQYNCLL